jgi:mannose-6-phosphate isomerase-like protein (cupin superfamily)
LYTPNIGDGKLTFEKGVVTIMPTQTPMKGQSFRFTGQMVTFRALAADTNGKFTLFECRVAPQQGALPHIERNVDEAFLVREGTFMIQIEDQQQQCGPGDFVFVPKLVPHAFHNIGSEVGRLLILTIPGGFHERFFAEIGELSIDAEGPLPTEPLDVEKVLAAGRRYGIEVLPPASEQKG